MPDDPFSGSDFPANQGQECTEYKCVPSRVFDSGGCPDGQVKRCAEFDGSSE